MCVLGYHCALFLFVDGRISLTPPSTPGPRAVVRSLQVLRTDLFIGARLRRCSITCEIPFNQMKHFEYERLPMRLDRFLAHDANVLGGVVARYLDELTKRSIAGETSLAPAARTRASASASASSASSAASASASAPAAAASASPSAFASASPPAAAASASVFASASPTAEAALTVGDVVVSEHCDARIKSLHTDDTATELCTGTQLEKRVPCVSLGWPRSSPPPAASPRVNEPLYNADGGAANAEAMRCVAGAAGITFDASLSTSRMAHGGGARSGVFRQQVAQMCGGGSVYAETAVPGGAVACLAADSDGNLARAIGAPPDQWRRGGGISVGGDARRDLQGERRVGGAADDPGKLATELAAFAFGGE